jgi:adenine-specific DNA methylase
VVPVVPVVSVAIVPAVLFTVDCDVAVDGSVVRSNRKYHKAIHSYISINGDKYFRNNSHCNYWHYWHNVV